MYHVTSTEYKKTLGRCSHTIPGAQSMSWRASEVCAMRGAIPSMNRAPKTTVRKSLRKVSNYGGMATSSVFRAELVGSTRRKITGALADPPSFCAYPPALS